MFSFYFTEAGDLSWVDLGEPDYENVREGERVVDIGYNNNYFNRLLLIRNINARKVRMIHKSSKTSGLPFKDTNLI